MVGTRGRREEFGSPRQLPSGRWQARYTGPDGAKHKAPGTFDTLGRARGWLSKEREAIDRGMWEAPAVRAKRADAETVAEWLTRWLESKRSTLRESSFQTLERIIENRVTAVDEPAAALARTPLAEVTRNDVRQWWRQVIGMFPDTDTTNRRAYQKLKEAFTAAMNDELIDANPVDLPEARGKAKPKDKELPEFADIRATLCHIDPRYKLVAVLTLVHGLRLGEALFLRRKHIVPLPDGGYEIRVRGNLQRLQIDGRSVMVEQPAKTSAGRREVPVIPDYVADVERHLNEFTGPSPEAMVTLTAKGALVLDTSFRSRLATAKRKAGVTAEFTPHYGRNLLVTLLAEQGATPAEIGRILGQRDLTTITETYMKVRAGNLKNRMAGVGSILAGEGT